MTQNLTNTGSRNPFKLCPCAANLKYSDLLPYNEKNGLTVTKVFIRKIIEMLLDHIRKTFDRNEKVLEFHQPKEMETIMDLTIPEKSLSLQQLLNDCHQTLQYHVKCGNPRYFNELSNGLDLVSMVGEYLAATCNVNNYSYEVASIFLVMENVVFKKMRQIIGWSTGDSIFSPGSSISNLYAILCARHKLYPDYKDKGTRKGTPGELVVFTSATGSMSIQRACIILGLGLDNCIAVPVEESGKMDVNALKKAIDDSKAKGDIPFFVNVTAGTMGLGAFDPIEEIAEVAQSYNMWLHVDASFGGALLMSKKFRIDRLNGIEKANSVTWDPHKLMNVNFQCSTIHFKDEGLLADCNCMKTLIQEKSYDPYLDTGDKSIQIGRRNDVFKFWLLWRARGDEGFEKSIDRAMELTNYMVSKLKEQSDKWYLILEPQMPNVCFWYMSRKLRDSPHDQSKEMELGKLCVNIKKKLLTAGSVMISYVKDDTRSNYFRATISSPACTEKDIDFLLSEIDRVGADA